MAKLSTVRLDRGGMDEMLSTSHMKRAVSSAAREIINRALANMSSHYTGPLGYKQSTEVASWRGTYGHKRAIARVRTTHMLGPALERKYAPLRKALRAAKSAPRRR